MIASINIKIHRFINKIFGSVFDFFGLKRYLFNFSWLFFGHLFFLIASFLVGVWIARYLGPDRYGLISYVVAFCGIFSVLISFGTDNILNRELVKSPDQRDNLLGTVFGIRLLGSLVAFIVSVSVAYFVNGQDNIWFLLVVIYSLGFFIQPLQVINIFFLSKVQSKNNTLAQFSSVIISSLLKILFIFLLKDSLILLIIIYISDYLWQGLILLLLYHKQKLSVSRWRFVPNLAQKTIKDSWPLMLSVATLFVYLHIDQVMIGFMMDKLSVGIYAIAVRIVEVFYFIPSLLCSALFPAIVNARKVSLVIFLKRLKYFFWLLGLIGFCLSVFIHFCHKFLVINTFGQDYLAAAPILRVYMWSSIGLFLSLGINQYLIVEHKTKTIFIINFLVMIMNIVLNLTLIPLIGLLGAAVATLISYSLAPLMFYFYNIFQKNYIKKYES